MMESHPVKAWSNAQIIRAPSSKEKTNNEDNTGTKHAGAGASRDRRQPSTSGAARRKSNGKGGNANNNRPTSALSKKDPKPREDETKNSAIPLRKWRRHSSLHHDSSDQPPTPEHYKVNPQRRRMWKIDLQREEDVRRMEILMQQLSSSRREQKSQKFNV